MAENNGDADGLWKWGLLAARTLRTSAAFRPLGLEVVDVEVLPALNRAPDRMAAWLIFDTAAEASAAKLRRDEVQAHSRDLLASAGFPREALRSFTVDFTSGPEIDAAGGWFAFFR
jgi:hypothetical protein